MEKLVSNKLSFETIMFWAILCIWGFALLSFVRYDGEEFIHCANPPFETHGKILR